MPAQKNRNKLPPAAELHPAEVHQLGGAELARYLCNPQRAQTVVVVSHLPGNPLRLDAEALAASLDGEAQLYELANGIETRTLEIGLPGQLHVFGNGARVYPHGTDWQARTSRPLLLQRAAQLPKLYEKIEREVFASQQLPPQQEPVTAPLPLLTEATVVGFPSPDRALVELRPDGTRAMIRSEELLPNIPLEWLVSKDQVLAGSFHPDTGTFDISALILPRLSPIKAYRHGDVALARVTSVRPGHALVHLWPGSNFRIGVEGISSNDLDSAQDLLTEDEVVRVRVRYDNGTVCLSMLDVDDDEPAVPAPSLLRGGPPWLDPDRPYASISRRDAVASPSPDGSDDDGETPPSGVEHGTAGHGSGADLPTAAQRRTALQSTQLELDTARHTIDELMAAAKKQGATEQTARALQDQLERDRAVAADLARRLNAAEHQVAALKEELARTKTSLVELRQKGRLAASRTEKVVGAVYLDPAEQFNFELHQAWAQIVSPHDKAAHPLGKYLLGPHFLPSWEALTEPQRARTLRAVVDLVAHRKGPLHNREPHHLRANEGAHAGAIMRGADVCMRLYVEQKTPGALRLHYWKLPTGVLELHEVVPHDVVKP
ncbi:hypothetical protein ART_3811 [Arthrobacter sp. PAMC 25486]|uniref:hypothetical protein n=1 Tax=Arthrobacter sp. PAMC 25486 TaxID=1494608 RepID=UPI000535CD6B|nr:hypothetical protein [Arthrobacter sp. PAMC 25486]AIY03410.1 hypothetical protein ART_3811 [Arthrobacter sp. PAMC 25486]